MSLYALISPGGEVLQYRTYPDDAPPAGNLAAVNAAKPRLVPVEVEGEAFDPVTQVLEGSTETVEATRVLRAYTARPKSPEEVAEMIRLKKADLEAIYQSRLYGRPGEIEVDGVVRTWHFDMNGVTKVAHMILLMQVGIVPSPQDWKPYGEPEIPVTQTGFMQIGGAYALRDRAEFTTLQARKAELDALADDPAAVEAFDPTAGWG